MERENTFISKIALLCFNFSGKSKIGRSDMARDEARIQELRNSIKEGEMILESRETSSGRKMSDAELIAVVKSLRNARLELEFLGDSVI